MKNYLKKLGKNIFEKYKKKYMINYLHILTNRKQNIQNNI